jgi:hypothetical protein
MEPYINALRAARRPKPPSLKEQALAVLDDCANCLDGAHENTIRRALEASMTDLNPVDAMTNLSPAAQAVPVAQPVPVSERLPGPEDCLDEGWAWFFNQRIGWRQAVLPVSPGYTHWLPAHALPTPEAQ